ncbi:glycosyltransferase [Myxacorys almedinensis A]|uniref:Glycosyltransferase n=1 Tax=Myxacorys almedinensis A TaxID=2690445 RepID=A0A8J7YXA0_9CYAN|nr:glycosyltransferase [Myxacorys almedinensis A]
MSGQLLVNLSFLASKPTGHTVYAKNLLIALESLDPVLLIGQALSNFRCYQISDQLTPDQGTKGHFSRLVWNQFSLPKLYKKLQGNLLFSPIPEAPLYSNCRYIVTLHDFIPLRFPRLTSPLTAYFRFYVPQILRQAEHILCDSESTAKDAFDFYQIPHSKMTVVPISYDQQHFRFLNLPTQHYFLYVGRHDPYKNLERLISAFATLSDRESELWIAGSSDDRYTPVLLAQAKELGVGHRVKFLSYVPYSELPILMNGAIALVFPSLWEGFGLPVLEAMACGTPVITSNLSSIPEVAGEAAMLVDPYNGAAIAGAMQTILSDPSLRTQLRQKGRDRAAQFSWQKTSATTAAILSRYL